MTLIKTEARRLIDSCFEYSMKMTQNKGVQQEAKIALYIARLHGYRIGDFIGRMVRAPVCHLTDLAVLSLHDKQACQAVTDKR